MAHLRDRPMSPPVGGTTKVRGVYGPDIASSAPPLLEAAATGEEASGELPTGEVTGGEAAGESRSGCSTWIGRSSPPTINVA